MKIRIEISNKALFFIFFVLVCALFLVGAILLGVSGALLVAGGVVSGAVMVAAAWADSEESS